MPINVHTPYQNVPPLDKFPNKIDDDIVLPFIDENDPYLPPGLPPSLWNDLNYAIKSIESELGILPSGGFGTVAERIQNIENISANFAQINKDLGGTGANPIVIGINGSPINLTSPIQNNQVLFYDSSSGGQWVAKFITIDSLKPTFFIDLQSTQSNILELGEPLSNPSFTADYTAPTSDLFSASLANSENSSVQSVIATPTAFSSNQSFTVSNSSQPLTFGGEITFTLSSSTNDNPSIIRSKSSVFSWGQKVYWGISTIPVSYNQSFIESLEGTYTGGSEVTLDKNRTINVLAGTGEYIYFACRSALGLANFLVNDFEGGFTLETSTVPVTNSFGITENYTIYRSDNSGLGVTCVIIF